MLANILLPTLTAILGGIGTWYVSQWLEAVRQKRALCMDCVMFSGKWHGIHLTRDAEYMVSRHEYDLTIRRSGRVMGTLVEHATNPPWRYKISGSVGSGGWVLRSQSVNRADEFSVEVYFNDIDSERIAGFIVSFDLERRPFCTFIMLSRTKMAESEFYDRLKEHQGRFYLPETV